MNSQKFMLIALILLSIIPGANPEDIFTGGLCITISELSSGLQEAFRNYATEIASLQTAVAEQRLQLEVAAYNALSQPGVIVSYFQSLDGQMMQEIFEGDPIRLDEVSAVWEIINIWYSTIFKAGQAVTGILSTSPGEFVTNLPRFLTSLSEFAMIANCIGIAYKGVTVMYSAAKTAKGFFARCSSAVASCGRVTIGTLKSLNAWLKSSGENGEVVASAPASSASSASSAGYLSPQEMLNLIANMPPRADNTPVEEILTFEGSISVVDFTNLVNALRNNGFNVINRDVIATRIASAPTYGPSDVSSFAHTGLEAARSTSAPYVVQSAPFQTVSAAAPAFAAPYQGVSAANSINSDVGYDFQHYRVTNDPKEKPNYVSPDIDEKTNIGVKRGRNGGRTKKHLKKKKNQRKSVRKQRKTKRGKRGRSRKSRRYKK